MSADGYVQVPANVAGGNKIDGASVDVAGNTVIRQRVVLADNSGSASFALITAGALLVQPNAVAISGTALVAFATQPPVAISGTAAVVVGAGTSNIGFINNISATVVVQIASSISLNISNTPTVVLAAGGSNIGMINGISATVNVAMTGNVAISGTANVVITNFMASSGQVINVVDTANTALRVNVVSGAGGGANPVSIAAGTSNIGFINNISATVAVTGNVALVAGSANIGFINGISATVNVVMATQPNVAISGTPSVVIAAGTANIGTLNDISRTVQVQIQTPFTINNISRTVEVTVSTPFTINAISATVTVTTANPYIINIPSASHGPRCIQVSTSATATLIAAPGAGLHIYVTGIGCANAGTNLTGVLVGWSGSLQQVNMVAAANGGGFVMNFDPPWKVQSNEAVLGRIDPNPGGNFWFNLNYFVST